MAHGEPPKKYDKSMFDLDICGLKSAQFEVIRFKVGTNGHCVQLYPSSGYKIVLVPIIKIHQNKFAKGGLSKPNRLWAPAKKPYPPADLDTIIPLRNANNGLDGHRHR